MDLSNQPPRWRIDETASVASNQVTSAWQSMSRMELRTLAGMLARQWRLILSVAILIVLLASGVLSQMNYRYTAQALLSIDARGSELVGQADPIGAGVTFNNQVDSEVEILNSSSVALGVIDRLALWRDNEFGLNRPSLFSKLESLVGITPKQNKVPDVVRLSELPGEMQSKLVDLLQSALRIERRGLTSVISIRATSKDVNKAALIANTVAQSYLDVQMNAKASTAQSAVEFLTQRVDELAKSLKEVNDKTENFILDQSTAVGTPEAKAEMLRIRDQITKLSTDEASFSTLLGSLRAFQQNPASGAPESLPAELRAIAEERAAAAQRALADARNVDLQQQLKELDNRLNDALTIKTGDIQTQLVADDKQRDDLRQQLQDIFTHQQIPNEVLVNLFRLQRNAEGIRKLYDTLSSRLIEVRQQVGLVLPNSRIVAPAIPPNIPSWPPTILILIAACILGLGLGTTAALARENLVGGFAMAAQVEAVTGLPVVTAIPRDNSKEPQKKFTSEPFSPFAESVRRLRLGVEERLTPQTHNVILVTSTEPGEGKSTLALCLARAMAAVGRRVVLIDCDFRHPSVGRLLGLKSPVDLVAYLRDGALPGEDTELAAQDTASSLLAITTSPSNDEASDVIVNSQTMRHFIKTTAQTFDYVILDSPPINYVVDAQILAEMSNYLLYVIKQNSTSQQDVISGLRQVLRGNKISHLGIVLNSVEDYLAGYYSSAGKYGDYYRKK